MHLLLPEQYVPRHLLASLCCHCWASFFVLQVPWDRVFSALFILANTKVLNLWFPFFWRVCFIILTFNALPVPWTSCFLNSLVLHEFSKVITSIKESFLKHIFNTKPITGKVRYCIFIISLFFILGWRVSCIPPRSFLVCSCYFIIPFLWTCFSVEMPCVCYESR